MDQRKAKLKIEPKTDSEFLAALLEAEIDPADALSIIDAWINGDRAEAISLLN